MASRVMSARSAMLLGLLLSLAVACCVPLVQGRLLQDRGDHEDGGEYPSYQLLQNFRPHLQGCLHPQLCLMLELLPSQVCSAGASRLTRFTSISGAVTAC
jgi:hypothetical protein